MLIHWRRLAVVVLVVFATACDFAEPSVRSNQLERAIIPSIAEWAMQGETDLKLSDLGDFRSGEAVCLVTEYHNLSDIERTDTVGEITSYHSSFGNHVPENRVAIVVVSDNRAHAAILPSKGAFYSILARTKCVEATRAVLRRNSDLLGVHD
jgi:hypothetical protein